MGHNHNIASYESDFQSKLTRVQLIVTLLLSILCNGLCHCVQNTALRQIWGFVKRGYYAGIVKLSLIRVF